MFPSVLCAQFKDLKWFLVIMATILLFIAAGQFIVSKHELIVGWSLEGMLLVFVIFGASRNQDGPPSAKNAPTISAHPLALTHWPRSCLC